MRLGLPCLLYVLDADHGTKVGITSQPIELRLSDIRRASGVDARLVRTFSFETWEVAYRVEQITHWLLASDRTYGEWFHTHPLIALDAVRHACRGDVYLEYLRRPKVAHSEKVAA